jgi:cytochrome P450
VHPIAGVAHLSGVNMPLPPGPPSAIWSTLQYLRDPYRASLRVARRYGDPYTIRTAVGRVVLTGDPDAAREILSADPEHYEPFGVDLLAPVIGARSLLLLSGDAHRRARKLLAPPFHGARMKAYAETMQSIAVAEAQRWQPGATFVMQESTQAISLRVILQTVFGATTPEKLDAFHRAVVDVFAALKPSFMFIKGLQSAWWRPWVRFQRATQAMEQLVYAEIAERRARADAGEDVLSLLLATRYDDGSPLEDRDLFEQLMTMVAAGHETTAIALAWAFHLVHTHPAVAERLDAELRAAPADADALARLPYLEAVCNETLRLMPLNTNLIRKLKRPITLKGFTLPAGLGVGVSVVSVHRSEELYPDAESFRPERFLERSFAPHEFLPFGGGARRCIGAAFAAYEMKVVLGSILQTVRLRSAETRPVRVVARNTVVGPGGGVRMVRLPN